MKVLDMIRLKDKKYIIFDMDGTLIDSVGVWNQVDQRLVLEYGGIDMSLEEVQIERDSFLHDNQSSDIYLAYCEYLISKYGLNIHDPSELLKVRWDISGKILEREMDFKPNVVELILKLKALGFTLILATMTTQVQLEIYSRRNRKMLNQMNIEEVFDLIIRKEDVKKKKPDPEIYNTIVQHYHANPSECLIFEDSYTGVLAGNYAGIEVVNVYDKHADLERSKIDAIADYQIHDYQEFIDFVNSVYGAHFY